MADLSTLIKKKKQYKNLLEAVGSLVSGISNINNLDLASTNISNIYTLNDTSADNGKIKNIDSDLESIKEKLSNIIMPAIKSKIRSIEQEIEQEESNNG